MVASMLAASMVFGSLAWFGTRLSGIVCKNVDRLPDGPPIGTAPIAWLVGGAAVIGSAAVWHQTPLVQLFLLGLICMTLVAAWCSDVAYGIVPDVFTLGPLVAILAYAVIFHVWILLFSAVVPFVPFALAAMASRGRGMGWGDAKLVALGGAVLGMQAAIVAFAGACVAAAVMHRVQGLKHGPIAFAPYLVAAIGLSLPFVH